MKRFLLISLLTLLVALTGCTTQDDLDQQTETINQHTTETVRDANAPIKKFEILAVNANLQCIQYKNDNIQAFKSFDITPFEHTENTQEFEDGYKLVRNGISDVDRVGDCTDHWEKTGVVETRMELETVEYNKSIYQDGRLIDSSTGTCELWEDGDLDEMQEAASFIYDECFDIDNFWRRINR